MEDNNVLIRIRDIILTRCRQHPNYAIVRHYAYLVVKRAQYIWRWCVYSNFKFVLLVKIFGVPKWFREVFPGIEKTRNLLGGEAYSYLISIAYRTSYYRDAMRDMARFLWNSGVQDYGIALYAALLNDYRPPEAPTEVEIVSYLQMMMFGSPEVQTNKHIYNEHVRWSQHFISGAIYKNYSNSLISNRRLRIGYTCHFITNSVSTVLLQPMLQAHDRNRIEAFVYSDEPPSEKTKFARGLVEHWRDTHDMRTDEFCELVRKDEIDILLEMNGHGVFNRYAAMARHPAPIQVAYYNYACTTGVEGMDYVFSSDDVEFEHLQPFYSEKIFRKSGVYHALTIGDHFPPISKPAFEKNGYITFCSFGQAHKVSREQIFLWCEVLKRVPGSKFFMKAQSIDESAKRAAFIHHFQDGGINKSRLILEGNSDYATLLKCYERVDIALDTYPCNAGTTTIEAIIMGVPVISMIGDRFCSQISRTNLESGGHPEFICKSQQEFIDKAVALASDRPRIINYRRILREDFRNSRRGDVKGFITELENAYTKMWRDYVAGHKRS